MSNNGSNSNVGQAQQQATQRAPGSPRRTLEDSDREPAPGGRPRRDSLLDERASLLDIGCLILRQAPGARAAPAHADVRRDRGW